MRRSSRNTLNANYNAYQPDITNYLNEEAGESTASEVESEGHQEDCYEEKIDDNIDEDVPRERNPGARRLQRNSN